MIDSPLNSALRQFEASEANLIKAEKVLAEVEASIPQGVAFGEDPKHEDNCRSFEALWRSLPRIDGWKPEMQLMGLDEIAQNRLDAMEIGELEAQLSVERSITEPSRVIREYRYRFAQKRRELVRDALVELIDSVDAHLRTLAPLLEEVHHSNPAVKSGAFEAVKNEVAQIGMLMGSTVANPPRWSDLHRHLRFGMLGDLHDIVEHDWPSVKAGLRKALYGEKEPVPVQIEDLGSLVQDRPRGPVATKLRWDRLTEDDFERLVFSLIASASVYENPEWLMKTNAPDRGRDLSAYRVYADPLAGVITGSSVHLTPTVTHAAA